MTRRKIRVPRSFELTEKDGFAYVEFDDSMMKHNLHQLEEKHRCKVRTQKKKDWRKI